MPWEETATVHQAKTDEYADQALQGKNPGNETEAQKPEKGTEPSETHGTSKKEGESAAAPLYHRLCGKYSLPISDDEYYTLEILSFGENLYALGGKAVYEEEDPVLAPYSFWAMELVPENKRDPGSGVKDAMTTGILTFSIMSNGGRYWGAPSAGEIRLTQEGIVFDGFDSSFPFGDGVLGQPFTKDTRLTDCFPYKGQDFEISGELTGLWREADATVPLYLSLSSDGDILLYRKAPDSEVYFAGGNCKTGADGTLFILASILGCGDMPIELQAGWQRSKEALVLNFDGLEDGPAPLALGDAVTFERITPEDLPVFTLSDITWSEETSENAQAAFSYDGMEVTIDGISLNLAEDFDTPANAITDMLQVGRWIVIEAHVNPHRNLYYLYNLDTREIEKVFLGAHLTWLGDDITTAVYSDMDTLYTFQDQVIGMTDGAEISKITFAPDGKAILVEDFDGHSYTFEFDFSELNRHTVSA